MAQSDNNALAPVNHPAHGSSKPMHPAVRFGTSALVALGRNPSLRQALLASAAFGVGYKVSAWARSGGLPQMAEDVRSIYRVANRDNLSKQGQITGSWVRESVTLITAVYSFLDRHEDSPKL